MMIYRINTSIFKNLSQLLILKRMSSTTYNTSCKLDGKVAIVTASTDGIGFSIAKRLAFNGAKVMISSRKSGNVEKAINELLNCGIPKDRLCGIPCHVGSQEDRQKMIEKTLAEFGGLDILVSNAAVNPHFGPAIECPESAWDKIFEINVKCSFLLCQEVYPHLRKKGGSITFISSIAAFSPFQLLGAYSVSKTALLGLTKILSDQLACEKIRVNCVAPGVIRTKFSSALTASEEIENKVLEEIPIGRLGEPDDVSGLVAFLVSDDASFITGENYVVAGGQKSRL